MDAIVDLRLPPGARWQRTSRARHTTKVHWVASVTIDLIVRGIWCLRPEMKGLSDTVEGPRVLASRSPIRIRAGGGATLRSQDWLYQDWPHEALGHRSGPLAATT